jgi:hypothetical protein
MHKNFVGNCDFAADKHCGAGTCCRRILIAADRCIRPRTVLVELELPLTVTLSLLPVIVFPEPFIVIVSSSPPITVLPEPFTVAIEPSWIQLWAALAVDVKLRFEMPTS